MFRPKNLGSRTMFLSSLMCQNIVAAPSKNQSNRSARPRPLPRAREPSHRLGGRCVHADACPFSARRRRRLRTERLGTIERSDQRVKLGGSFPPTEFPARRSIAVAAFGTPAAVCIRKSLWRPVRKSSENSFQGGFADADRKKQPFKRAGALSRGAGAGVRKGFGRHGAAGHVRADGVPHPVHVGLRRQAGACATANLVGIPRVHGVSPVLLVLHAPRVSRQSRRRPTRSTISNPRGTPRSRPRLTHPIANARRSTCAGRSLTGWRRCRWPPSPRPTGAACSRWCATCRRGTTSTSSSWMASGGTTRTRRSSRILWVTSTTGASIDPRARPSPARAQRPAATKPIPQNPPPRANNNPRFFPDGMPLPPLPDTDPRY